MAVLYADCLLCVTLMCGVSLCLYCMLTVVCDTDVWCLAVAVLYANCLLCVTLMCGVSLWLYVCDIDVWYLTVAVCV